MIGDSHTVVAGILGFDDDVAAKLVHSLLAKMPSQHGYERMA